MKLGTRTKYQTWGIKKQEKKQQQHECIISIGILWVIVNNIWAS